MVKRKKYQMGYDSKCHELAEHFLDEIDRSKYENDITEQLAMFIQKEVEMWIDYDLKLYEKKEK